MACRAVFAALHQPILRAANPESEGHRRSRRAATSALHHAAGSPIHAADTARISEEEEEGRGRGRSCRESANQRNGSSVEGILMKRKARYWDVLVAKAL